MVSCPLCHYDKQFALSTYAIKDLSDAWKRSFEFDPFTFAGEKDEIRKLKCGECGMVHYDPPMYGDKEFYERLSQNPWYYEHNKWEFDHAIDLICHYKPESILEIGCGAGCFLDKVVGFTRKAEGTDINDSALDACRNKNHAVFYADITSSNGAWIDEPKKYDMVLLFEVLEHLQNPDLVFSRLNALLNDNGLLVIAVPNPDGYLKELDINLLDMPPHHNTIWSADVFRYIADKYHWKIIEHSTEPIRYVHYVYYLQAISAKIYFSRKSLKNTILSKLNSLAITLGAPFSFTQDRQHLLGQTQMVVFQKYEA